MLYIFNKVCINICSLCINIDSSAHEKLLGQWQKENITTGKGKSEDKYMPSLAQPTDKDNCRGMIFTVIGKSL